MPAGTSHLTVSEPTLSESHSRETADTVPATAGVLVEPGNVKALTRALRMVIENEEGRRRLARGALAAAADLPTWSSTARIFASALERLR